MSGFEEFLWNGGAVVLVLWAAWTIWDGYSEAEKKKFWDELLDFVINHFGW
jgi:hypothetical protein